MVQKKQSQEGEVALFKKAQTAVSQQNYESAVKILTGLVERNKENLDALTLLGRVLMQQGKLEDAASRFEAALVLSPKEPRCLNALGSILFSLHRPEESESYFREALQAAPGFVEAVGNLGLVCQHLGKHGEALERLQIAVHSRGATPQIALALGRELIHQLQPVKAKAVLSQLVKAQPQNAEALVMLGVAASDCGEPEMAEALWKQVEAIDPANPGPAVSRARARQNAGDIEGAVLYFEQALELNPHHAYALFSWTNVADGHASSALSRPDVIQMITAAQEQPGTPHDDAVWLGFAAGKLLDAEKQYAAAAENYIHANNLVWQVSPVKKEMYQSWHNRLVEMFDAEFFARNRDIVERKPEGDDRCGEGLVFVVGMPRSGTTLIEQIISRTDTVTPGGERPDMDMLGGPFLDQIGSGPVGRFKPLDLKVVRQLSAQYHKNIRKLSGSGGMFTDKSPRNFMNLGVIACLFPKSRIIHCLRNPVDTCLSCYFNHFGHNAVSYSYNQDMLGFFHSLYEQMMRHWQQVLPMDIHDAVYEDIVSTPDVAIRELTAFLDLEWNNSFLHPEDSKRAVNTASLAQVKKPIYRQSVGRSEPYEPYLKPLLNALKD